MALKNFYREIFDNISVSPYVGRNPNSASWASFVLWFFLSLEPRFRQQWGKRMENWMKELRHITLVRTHLEKSSFVQTWQAVSHSVTYHLLDFVIPV
jgi:hypothetical protein